MKGQVLHRMRGHLNVPGLSSDLRVKDLKVVYVQRHQLFAQNVMTYHVDVDSRAVFSHLM